MKFTKMHGLGNDYILIDCFKEKVGDPSALAVRLSDRHFGVGADGIILVCPSDVADFKMRMFNSLDGSEAQMCGNGIRCLAKYVYDRGLTDRTELAVETLSGIRNLWLKIEGGKVFSVRVDMGPPALRPDEIPVISSSETFINQPVLAGGRTYMVTCVGMGNPHAVVFVDDPDSLDLASLGPALENHPIFPERANVEFVRCAGDETLQMRVWERGSGETLACGSGACAALVAAVLCKKCRRRATVVLRGGKLVIEWDPSTNHVFMEGPSAFVFDGETAD